MSELQVVITVRKRTGESPSGYPNWQDLAELTVPSDEATAWAVYRDALAALTSPRIEFGPPGSMIEVTP